MYHKITSRIYTIRMRIGPVFGDVSRELPEFYVEAGSKKKAEAKARKIIDPLQMTGAEIDIVRIRRFREGKNKKH